MRRALPAKNRRIKGCGTAGGEDGDLEPADGAVLVEYNGSAIDSRVPSMPRSGPAYSACNTYHI